MSLVNDAFEKLQVKFTSWPHSLKTQSLIDAYKRDLLEGFIERGIGTSEKIDRFIANAKKKSGDTTFLPSVEILLNLGSVNPEDLGLCSGEEAYRLACIELGKHKDHREWTHETIWKAANDTKFSNFKLEDGYEREVKKDFLIKYKDICNRYASGERFTIPEERRIEKTEAPPAGKEFNINAMANLRANLGI